MIEQLRLSCGDWKVNRRFADLKEEILFVLDYDFIWQ